MYENVILWRTQAYLCDSENSVMNLETVASRVHLLAASNASVGARLTHRCYETLFR